MHSSFASSARKSRWAKSRDVEKSLRQKSLRQWVWNYHHCHLRPPHIISHHNMAILSSSPSGPNERRIPEHRTGIICIKEKWPGDQLTSVRLGKPLGTKMVVFLTHCENGLWPRLTHIGTLHDWLYTQYRIYGKQGFVKSQNRLTRCTILPTIYMHCSYISGWKDVHILAGGYHVCSSVWICTEIQRCIPIPYTQTCALHIYVLRSRDSSIYGGKISWTPAYQPTAPSAISDQPNLTDQQPVRWLTVLSDASLL